MIWYFMYCEATGNVKHFLTMAAPKKEAWSARKTPIPQRKLPVVQYNKHANKAKITSVTSENVQECLESMGLGFSK